MKILLLSIYSKKELYDKMLELQRKYIHTHKNITSYFVQMTLNIDENIIIKDDMVFVNGNESVLNILYKTIKALELLTTLDQYDYVIRTNISTVSDLNKLYEYCIQSPRKNLYTGGRILELNWLGNGITDETHFGTIFIQGSFIVFSIDLIQKILKDKDKLDYSIVDDVSIGLYIKQHTDIYIDIIQKTKPVFCLDHICKTKLKDYTTSEYVAYRNKRTYTFSYGDRKTDIPEIKNQINCLYPNIKVFTIN